MRGVEFFKSFLRRLAKELDRPSDANEGMIAEALSKIGKPAAVLSFMVASEWQADEDKRIGAWLETWHRLAAQPQRFSALPMLCLKMPAAKPGWTNCPGGIGPGATMSNAAIWRAVVALQRKPSRLANWIGFSQRERAMIGIPPLLHPVTRGHADSWLSRTAISAQLKDDVAAARTLITSLFDRRAAISLRDFAIGMMPLFRSGG
jgi:hypothetical protein